MRHRPKEAGVPNLSLSIHTLPTPAWHFCAHEIEVNQNWARDVVVFQQRTNDVNMAAKHWQERIFSRFFHVFITVGIILVLLLKDTGNIDIKLINIVPGAKRTFFLSTELSRSAYEGRWLFASIFLGLVLVGFIFYFVASFIDPGYLEIKSQNSILVSYEVSHLQNQIDLRMTPSFNKLYINSHNKSV